MDCLFKNTVSIKCFSSAIPFTAKDKLGQFDQEQFA